MQNTTCTAYEQALRTLYSGDRERLDGDIAYYSRSHFAFCTPRFILLAKLLPTHWHIHLACSLDPLPGLLYLMPEYRPLISWARGARQRKLRYFRTDRLIKILCKNFPEVK